jgi:hypothetical protein
MVLSAVRALLVLQTPRLALILVGAP